MTMVQTLSWTVGGISTVAYASAFGHPAYFKITGKEGDWTLSYPDNGAWLIREGFETQISARRAAQVHFESHILGGLVAVSEPASPSSASVGSLSNALELTGCESEEDLIDMANVGSSLMSSIDSLVSQPGPYHHWSPAEDPAEIVFDLVNDLDEVREKLLLLQKNYTYFGCAVEHAAKVSEAWKSSLVPGSDERLAGHQEAARDIAAAIRAMVGLPSGGTGALRRDNDAINIPETKVEQSGEGYPPVYLKAQNGSVSISADSFGYSDPYKAVWMSPTQFEQLAAAYGAALNAPGSEPAP